MIKKILGGLAVMGVMAAAPLHAGELPESVKTSGTLNLAINATSPPMEYKDTESGKFVGLDIDLVDALAARLKLKVERTDVAFAQLMPSLATSRTDFIWSAISDLPARQESMDFIDYLKTGTQFFTLNSAAYATPEDLCGKKVGSVRSTQYPQQTKDWSAANCEAKGKPAIEVVGGENAPDVRLQLKQGRIDAAAQGSETIPFISKQEGNAFKTLGGPFTSVNYGIAFRKQDTAFRDFIADAVQAMIDDGTYKKILDKWELGHIGVEKLTINTKPR